MSAQPEQAPDWTPEELWIIAFGERLRDTSDSAGIGRRRDEINDAEAGGKVSAETAVALRAELARRRRELFAALRTRGDRFTSARARRTTPGGRLPFPSAGRRAS